jgi:hypothetical protein
VLASHPARSLNQISAPLGILKRFKSLGFCSSIRARVPHGPGGHRLEAHRRAVSQRTVQDVAEKNPKSEAVQREREEEWS